MKGVVCIMRKTLRSILFSALLILSLTACFKNNTTANTSTPPSTSGGTADAAGAAKDNGRSTSELMVRFGSSSPFILYLEDNDTAAAIAHHVGTAAWQLPIYHYDDYEGWEVFQYYDIPSRYEIPSNAETVTSETAGQVYYSEPNRIVLFYHDGEISGEYTLVGHFDVTDDLISAVENNPVLEGWGNKLVHISAEK